MNRCYVGVMALGIAFFPLAAQAAGFPGFMAKVTGKNTSVGTASNGTPIVTTGVGLSAGGGWQSAGNYGVAQGAAGAVNVGGKGNVPVNGKNVPVEVTGTISKGDIAAAAVGCATGGVVGCAVSAIPLAIAWMNLSGTRINPETGQLERQSDPAPGCGAPDGSAKSIIEGAGNPDRGCYGQYGGVVIVIDGISLDGPNTCKVTFHCSNGTNPNSTATWGRGAWSPTWNPATPQEVRDALIAGGPPSPLIVPELEKAGAAAALPIGNIRIIGPATITSSTTTTTNNIDNSVKTSTTINNYTYNGGTVTNTGSTTQTVTKAADGTTTGDTTETMNPGEDEPVSDDASPVDTALPPVPTLYERKYPNGMEGIWNDYKDQLKGTDLVSLVGKLMPNVGDGGSCPTWPINLDLEQWASYGTHDVAPPCWIWDVAKAILILSALLLARSLVFGG